MLAKKRDAGQDANQSQGAAQKAGRANRIPPLLTSSSNNPHSDHPLETAPVESKHIVAVPPELQQLVREISVAVNARGK